MGFRRPWLSGVVHLLFKITLLYFPVRFWRRRKLNSRSCLSSTAVGRVGQQTLGRWVSGGQSRRGWIRAGHQRYQTVRPNAKPPCGGAPNFRLSKRKLEFFLLLFGADFPARRTLFPARRHDGYGWNRHRFPSRSTPCRRRGPGSFQDRMPSGLQRPGLGEVNGWCMAVQRSPSSVVFRTLGNRRPNKVSIRPRSSRFPAPCSKPTLIRSAPRYTRSRLWLWSAPKKMMSPFCAPVRAMISFRAFSDREFHDWGLRAAVFAVGKVA